MSKAASRLHHAPQYVPKVQTLLALVLLALPALAGPPEAPERERRRSPVVQVFEQCRDAVVNVSTTQLVQGGSLGPRDLFGDLFDFRRPGAVERRSVPVGSGVVIHEDGYLVTNAHVVSQLSDVVITFADKTTLPAEIVAVDHDHDLAVVKVNAGRPLTAIRLGHSRDIMIGETVVAIGNPLGLQHTCTSGIVSALERELEGVVSPGRRGAARLALTNLIQTDAAINPGNSGGPLINVNSELIGINTAIRSDAQNVGFSIPVDRLWDLLPGMLDIEKRQRVRFGLEVAGPDAEVLGVRADSPAEKAGVRVGDHVLRLNEHAVRSGIDYYVTLLEQKAGQTVRLAVRRGAQTPVLDVPLVEIPLPDGNLLARQLMGVEVKPLPDSVRRRYKLPAGMLVDKIAPGAAADQAGMRAGDIIVRLDRLSVSSSADLGLLLERVRPGDDVLVEGVRLQADPPFSWRIALETAK